MCIRDSLVESIVLLAILEPVNVKPANAESVSVPSTKAFLETVLTPK